MENKQLEMDTFRAKTKFQLVLYPTVAAFDCYIYMCAYWEIKQEFLKQLTECEYTDCQRAPIQKESVQEVSSTLGYRSRIRPINMPLEVKSSIKSKAGLEGLQHPS